MNKELLIEYIPFIPLPKQLNEVRSNPNANLIVSGKVQAANKPNANNRVYDANTLRREIDKYIKGPIAENRALGELDHPESSIITLKNVCHNLKKLWWQGDDVYGEFEILPTPSGEILKQLFLNGVSVGVSSRAMGSVSPLGEGLVQVGDDLEMICWDFVSTPSTYGSFVKPNFNLNEGFNREQEVYEEYKFEKVNKILTDIICTQTGICCLR